MENHHSGTDLYALVSAKAKEIETELKRLNRWQSQPPPAEKFENMGAFGSNVMAFEQWIQFILIPRIQETVHGRGEFPTQSRLATYAVRVFDGDAESENLQELLYELDNLINEPTPPEVTDTTTSISTPHYSPEVETIPEVVYVLAEVLPQFNGEDLESQLQTFDAFLQMLSPSYRQAISNLLLQAAANTSDPVSKERIEKASRSVANGGRAAEPYNHEEAMRKYREEHKKNFPS